VLLPAIPLADLRVLHLGGYWRGPNDIVRQMYLGLAETGAQAFELCTDDHLDELDPGERPYDRGTCGPVWVPWELLRTALDEARPHLVICNAGGLSLRPDDAARERGQRTLLGIAHSDPDVHLATTRHIATNFDAFLTNAPTLVGTYRAMGLRADTLPPGTHAAFFRPVAPRPEQVCEVLVLGRAHPDRVAPVRELVRRFDTHVYGEGWAEHGIESRGLIYGEEALSALSSAAMTVIFLRTSSGHALLKVGLFDFLAAGALVLTERSPLVEPYFEFGRHLVGFGSHDELLAAVRHYLDRPQEAAAIRAAGREHVLLEYSWRKVWLRSFAWLAGGVL